MEIAIEQNKLRQFVSRVFQSFGLSQSKADTCADVLVTADLRGIESHGVGLLPRYLEGIRTGFMVLHAEPEVVRENPSTATVDGHLSFGPPVAVFSTELAIQKALTTGVGMVTVRNSNHFGIAGYYTQLILDAGMIGIAMTNASPQVVPTFGRRVMLGTNPISMAAPAGKNRPFLLDMATSVIPRNKLDVYQRAGKSIPEGWAVDGSGKTVTDPETVVQNIMDGRGGGILPLGGIGELLSGHKGYGLALLVDILCGVLSGGMYADRVVNVKDGKIIPATHVSHFFMAIKIENFVAMETFTSKMDDLIDRLKSVPKAEGQSRIYIHGEKEYENMEKYGRAGIPLQKKVVDSLIKISKERNIAFDFSIE